VDDRAFQQSNGDVSIYSRIRRPIVPPQIIHIR
jgi:hypothetical protein